MNELLSKAEMRVRIWVTWHQPNSINLLHFAVSKHLGLGRQSRGEGLDGLISIGFLLVTAQGGFLVPWNSWTPCKHSQ